MSALKMDDVDTLNQSEPVALTFIWPALPNAHGISHAHAIRILAADGDVRAVVERVREQGGLYDPDKDGEGGWLLPWPPAGIRIEPDGPGSDLTFTAARGK